MNGVVEADATSLRKWREDGNLVYFQLFGLYRRPSAPGDRGNILLYDMGCNKALKSGKPPPESRSRLDCTRAFDQLSSTCVLITDGAPVYPGICEDYGIKHFACNHSRGIFNLKKRYRNKTIDCHTGGVDGCWKMCKGSIPVSLSSKKTRQLMKHARIWQWRWHQRQTNLALALGKALANF